MGAHLWHVSVSRLLEAEHGLLVLLVAHGSKRTGVAESDSILARVGLDVIDVVLECLWDVAVALAVNGLELSPLLLVRGRSLQGRARDGRVGWRTIGDTALVHATLDEHVTVGAPGRTPGILHLPVVGAALGAVTHCEHTVVEVGAAAAGQHTTAVQLEAHLIGLNGNADRASVGNSIEEGRFAGDVLETSDTTFRDGSSVAGLAGAITASVGVGRLGRNAGALVELEGVVHETAIAARVLLGAIHQLLLTEGLQAASCNFPLSFQTTSGGEGPAGSALALVLDRGHCTLGAPVDAGRGSLAGFLVGAHLWHVTH